MPEDEEVLGEEEATASEEEAGGGGGGLFDILDFSGGVMDSIVVKMLVGAIALVAIVLLVIFIASWTVNNVMQSTDPEAGQAEEATQRDEAAASPLSTFELEEFVMTKRDPRSGRVSTFQIKLHLAYNQEAKNDLGSELENRRPQIRDKVYSILGSKDIEDLTYVNKQSLKDDLIVELNRLLQSRYRIQDIYFTQFVIQ